MFSFKFLLLSRMLEAWAPNVRLGEQVAVEGTSLWKVMKLMKRRKSHRMICCVESWLCARYSIRGTKFTVSLTMYYQVSHASPQVPSGHTVTFRKISGANTEMTEGGWDKNFWKWQVQSVLWSCHPNDKIVAWQQQPAICWKNPLYWAHSKFMMLERFINRHLMSIPQYAVIDHRSTKVLEA